MSLNYSYTNVTQLSCHSTIPILMSLNYSYTDVTQLSCQSTITITIARRGYWQGSFTTGRAP